MILKGEFGQFARILIDIDLSQPISNSLMVEVGSDCFFIPLEYELPHFFSTCQTIGHAATSFKHGNKVRAPIKCDSKMTRGRSRIRKQVYRPITKSPKATEVHTHVVPSNVVPTKALVTNSMEVPIKNSFSLLVNTLRINNEVEHEKEKKKIQSIDDVSKTNRLSQNP
ncbi:LOW QUALITY PROTEIN: hypothetical protein TorRG33x02_221890 [Trema orientale]|uniref:Zinc knuckle CX2CX4HX4C n=1 Tax=Trema orientale TaxID=63057 RepID=A0A2P5E8V3_TREOI|nr:LOW QUALITY PROTEIN: hypothetical protein TorRG33x02_221890 [Trema orientale]